MKKTVRLLSILLAAMLMLSSCSNNINEGSHVSDDYLYVKGTAVKNKTTGLYEFASATIKDRVDLTRDFVPVDTRRLINDVEDNVMFRCPDPYYSVKFESKTNNGYIFEEWKVRKLENLVTKDMYSWEIEDLKEQLADIERFLDKPTYDNPSVINRYSEKPDSFNHEYMKYIYPEYNKAPVYLALIEEDKLNTGKEWIGNGTMKAPYSLEEFRDIYGNAKEINVILSATDNPSSYNLSDFLTELNNRFSRLEEIHIKANDMKTLADIGSLLSRFDYVDLKNIVFDGNIELLKNTNTEWKFTNCSYNRLTCFQDTCIKLNDCTGIVEKRERK